MGYTISVRTVPTSVFSAIERGKYVAQMEPDRIIKQQPSPWDSAITIVAKSDGKPRFCVDYRTSLNKYLLLNSWLMPTIESHIDMVAGTRYTTV